MVYLFPSVNMMYYVHGFVYVEPPLHPWNTAYLVVVYNSFNMLLGTICQDLVGNFCIYM